MPAYRDEKTKTWYVKFRFTDWQGKSKHTTKRGFKTKKDALNYEHEFKATAEERVDITVASLAEKYLEDRKLHVKLSAFNTSRSDIKNHILPYIGEVKYSRPKEVGASCFSDCRTIASIASYIVSTGVSSRSPSGTYKLPCRTSDTFCNKISLSE